MSQAPAGAGRGTEPGVSSADGRPGVVGRRAPDWNVETWRRLPGGAEHLEVGDLPGRVIYLFCFQSWCPGCHSVGFPAFRSAVERADGDRRIAFVAVQTVFEGLRQNTLQAGLDTVDKFGLDVPVGHTTATAGGAVPALMDAYRTGGTPWSVIIGPDRVVRLEGFNPEPDQLAELVEQLLSTARPGVR